MEMKISFAGGQRIDAGFDGFTVRTDQPTTAGGGGTAPSPFDLFLASVGTCTAYYVLRFCQTRGLPTDDVHVTLRATRDEAAHRVTRMDVQVDLPQNFPAELVAACARAAESCAVKRHLETPPAIVVSASRRSA
ncbi:MAG: OsmC family protein [Candidatus Bipolaricaulota bacterium]